MWCRLHMSGLTPVTDPTLFPSVEPAKSSIVPFRALKRPLQFLGLFETSLCRLAHIPAYKVSIGWGQWGGTGRATGAGGQAEV